MGAGELDWNGDAADVADKEIGSWLEREVAGCQFQDMAREGSAPCWDSSRSRIGAAFLCLRGSGPRSSSDRQAKTISRTAAYSASCYRTQFPERTGQNRLGAASRSSHPLSKSCTDMRWKIETFHKILKSVFKAEEIRLRAAERIVNLIAVLCLLSWRISERR
jgi:hypothetical protein